jgi:hypothetical protein
MNELQESKPSLKNQALQPLLPLAPPSSLPEAVRNECVELLAEMLKSIIVLERKEQADER